MQRLYVDFMSQPSRACVLFCRLNGLPVEEVAVFIHKGETRSPAYRAVNPLGKVPCLVDGALALPESGAILTYLARQHGGLVADHWYPADSRARARVESALHWYHANVRAGAMRVAFNKVIAARLGLQGNPEIAEEGLRILGEALTAMQKHWLAGEQRPFLAGERISIADLLCCCELEQLCMLDKTKHGVDMEGILGPYPAVQAWMARVRAACAPHYEAVHQVLRRAAAAGSAPQPAAAQAKL